LYKEEKKEENQSISLLPVSFTIPPTSMTTVFTARAKEEKKEDPKTNSENKNITEQKTLEILLNDAKNEPDAMIRSKYYARYLFRKYWNEENRIPAMEEYRQNYRTEVGTGPEDEEDVKRLEYIYNAYVREFNPQKMHKSKYYAGEYITRLHNIITQEQINEFVRENTCYKYTITYEDLDLVAGCFYLSLSGKLEQKEWCSKELTVPFHSIIKIFKYMKAQGQSKKSCNNGKCKALIELLKHIDWVNCVDESYSTRTHRSRRYILTEKHPKYKSFEQAVGKEVIDRFRPQQFSVQIVSKSA